MLRWNLKLADIHPPNPAPVALTVVVAIVETEHLRNNERARLLAFRSGKRVASMYMSWPTILGCFQGHTSSNNLQWPKFTQEFHFINNDEVKA
jgi:hypothetical protein